MQSALRLETMVLPGNRIEIGAPELPEGAKVEVIVLIRERSSGPTSDAAQAQSRTVALDQFLALARSSSFRSDGPYPTRDDLR